MNITDLCEEWRVEALEWKKIAEELDEAVNLRDKLLVSQEVGIMRMQIGITVNYN